jgi:hypothetical protein
MRRETLERCIAVAEAHAAEARDDISRQRRIVNDLERNGHDTSGARSLLATFEDLQQAYVTTVAMLGKDLEEMS